MLRARKPILCWLTKSLHVADRKRSEAIMSEPRQKDLAFLNFGGPEMQFAKLLTVDLSRCLGH